MTIDIICVDDCSNDESASIVNNYAAKAASIRLLRNSSRRGAAFSRKRFKFCITKFMSGNLKMTIKFGAVEWREPIVNDFKDRLCCAVQLCRVLGLVRACRDSA